MINFKNKKVLITGATGGIGKSIVKRFISLEANVLGTGTKTEKLDALKKEFPSIKTKQFDLSQHPKVEEFIENVFQDLNGLDILVNNAGVNVDNLSLRMKEEEWKKVIDINLTSTFLITKNVIKKMLKSKNGKIINVTSVVGHSGNIGQANYAASKAAIIAMSKSLALEYGKKNIIVNCVSPGFIISDMTDKISEEHTELLKSRISLNKFGNPGDVANTIAFLSSNLSNYITGETIHVNGGMYFS